MKAFTSNQIWSFLTINLFRNLWCDKIGQYWPNSKLTNWLIHWPCHRLGCVKIQGKITTNYKLLVFTCFDKVFDVIEFGITFLNPIYHLRGKLLYWRVRAMPFQSTFMNLQVSTHSLRNNNSSDPPGHNFYLEAPIQSIWQAKLIHEMGMCAL